VAVQTRRAGWYKRSAALRLEVREEPAALLLVRGDLVRAIAAQSTAAGANEVGGPLFGTVERSWNGSGFGLVVSILATVPERLAVLGASSSVALGSENGDDGERAASALLWLRSLSGLNLLHLGDWHRHPGHFDEPSGGDLRTARDLRTLAAAPIWLIAIAVGGEKARESARADDGVVTHVRTSSAASELRFYRVDGRAGCRRLPVRIEGATIPRLPPLPWHIADPTRFAVECRLLAAAGFAIALEETARDKKPETVLRLSRDSRPALLVSTGPGYPKTRPRVSDERRCEIRIDGPWSPERFLADLASEVEK
jgi:hypothetical protein